MQRAIRASFMLTGKWVYTLLGTNSDFTPENWWLGGDDPFLLGRPGAMYAILVLRRVIK